MWSAWTLLVLLVAVNAIPHELVPDRAERFAEAESEQPAPEYAAPAAPAPAPAAPALKPAIVAKQDVNILTIPAIPVQLTETPPTEDEWVAENSQNDPELHRINMAMEAVRDDMISTSHQLAKELKWIAEVKKIMAEYREKVTRVQAHVHELREQIKVLYHKKVQIKNLRLQHELEEKLREAQDELSTLLGSLDGVKRKRLELGRSREDLQATIASIQSQLDELKMNQKSEQQAAADDDTKIDDPTPVTTPAPAPTPAPAAPAPAATEAVPLAAAAAAAVAEAVSSVADSVVSP